jgi:hypothetical protein
MKHYQKSININTDLNLVWEYLSDLNNFARFNPYHKTISFLTNQIKGQGTLFRTNHSFWPIFPIPNLETICQVTLWDENKKRINIFEQPILNLPIIGERELKQTNHTQKYSLIEKQEGISFVYEVIYKGLPDWMKLANQHVNSKVNQVIQNELIEIKKKLEKK